MKKQVNNTRKIDGYLYVGADLDLPALQSVGGSLYVDADLDLPALQSVGGSLYVRADLDAPALQSVGGYLDVSADLDAPALQSVGGSLYVRADLDAPALQSVGGYLYVNADLDAPTLEKINGLKVKDIKYINRENFIKLTGACSEGVDDFITRTGHESLPIAKLSRVLTKENLYGAKTIAWIIKQQKILKGIK